MKPKYYNILEECIEEGAKGWLWNEDVHPPKHQQDADRMAEKISDRVMLSICERFDFDDEIRG